MDREKTPRPEALAHQGPYLNHPPVAAFAAVSEQAFALFCQLTGGSIRSETSGDEFLATRLMYIAQVTSTAIRLNASWALSHAAMSLARDRYEQVVRFSWLARQSDREEMEKYLASYYAKIARINATMPPELRAHMEPPTDGRPDIWQQSLPTKEERASLERWNALDLKSMAAKRDGLIPLTQSAIGSIALLPYYYSLYMQFSSVTHYDMFGVSMLGLHKNPQGQIVLAADPQWPAFLNLHNAMFDLIQCYEACRAFYGVSDIQSIDRLYAVFDAHVQRFIYGNNADSAATIR